MSDKPLDAIGLDSSAGVGKHDFVANPHFSQSLLERPDLRLAGRTWLGRGAFEKSGRF
jgi:hypothetical protein